MVSLARRRSALYPVLLIIVIFIGTVAVMAGDQTLQQVPNLQPTDTIELKYGKMSFTLEGGANFLSRRDDFGYVFGFLGTPGFPIEGPRTNYDSLGGGEITVGYHINDKHQLSSHSRGHLRVVSGPVA